MLSELSRRGRCAGGASLSDVGDITIARLEIRGLRGVSSLSSGALSVSSIMTSSSTTGAGGVSSAPELSARGGGTPFEARSDRRSEGEAGVSAGDAGVSTGASEDSAGTGIASKYISC